jgi:hypothetical protein
MVISSLVTVGLVVLTSFGLAAPQTSWFQGNWGNDNDWSNYWSNQGGHSYQDSQNNPEITISSSANPSIYGQWVTFTATVQSDKNVKRVPSGKVTFKQGRKVLAIVALNKLGQASFSTNRFAATGSSSHWISVEYAADNNSGNGAESYLIQKINPATLTVTANSQSRPYGAANPALTVTYSGFVNGETLATSDITGSPNLTTGATTNSAPGSYPIDVAAGTLASLDYKFVFVNGTLKVTSPTTTPNSAVPNVSLAQPQIQPNQSVTILLTGPAGRTFVVEASTDLVHWTAISTNNVDTNGVFTVVDPDAKNYPRRFYRGGIIQ